MPGADSQEATNSSRKEFWTKSGPTRTDYITLLAKKSQFLLGPPLTMTSLQTANLFRQSMPPDSILRHILRFLSATYMTYRSLTFSHNQTG